MCVCVAIKVLSWGYPSSHLPPLPHTPPVAPPTPSSPYTRPPPPSPRRSMQKLNINFMALFNNNYYLKGHVCFSHADADVVPLFVGKIVT